MLQAQINKEKKRQRSIELAKTQLQKLYGTGKVDWEMAIRKAEKIQQNTAIARAYLQARYDKLKHEPVVIPVIIKEKKTWFRKVIDAIRGCHAGRR
jgi:hypothetical protein